MDADKVVDLCYMDNKIDSSGIIKNLIKCIPYCLVMFLTITIYGQEKKLLEDFKISFTKALDKTFSGDKFYKMLNDYSELLTPNSYVTKLPDGKHESMYFEYPLHEFKDQRIYTGNIYKLLASQNSSQRILAYAVIAASNDTSKENILLNRLITEQDKESLNWAGISLLYLKCNHTTQLFDFLVINEDFGDAHMLPLYIQLDKDSLRQTAYERINNKDEKSKILAAQILSKTALNSTTEILLKKAINDWDFNIKGYAIYSIKELRIGNLLETFEPLLNDSRTRSISLEALANSPTESDRNYLLELVNKEDTISDELLNCFYHSKNIDNVKYWLRLLYTKQISDDYSFFTFDQPLINSDDILEDLHIALRKINNYSTLGELVRALNDRSDDESIEIMISFLKHKSPTVRYWTAKILETNKSDKLRNPETQKLITEGLKDEK